MRPEAGGIGPRGIVFCLFATLALASGLTVGCGSSEAEAPEGRPDLVVLDEITSYGEPERPLVLFPHDLHTKALTAENKDCGACHPKNDSGYYSIRYQRPFEPFRSVENPGEEFSRLRELYHDGCISCHEEMAGAGKATGPVTCGECHAEPVEYRSTALPFMMDLSLHYGHLLANNDSCALCHHQYDEARQELVYVEGEERSCRDCHRDATEDDRVSMRLAAHNDCVNCHVAKKQGVKDCAGCHDAERRKQIVKVENPPRLKRGQPDFTLIAPPKEEWERSKLGTVPFSHVNHESFAQTCRVCHHESLRACSDCHTLEGGQEAAGVNLQSAMHQIGSEHSCVGCHDQEKNKPRCFGCHGFMKQNQLSEHACEICHTGPTTARLPQARDRYNSIEAFKPSASEMELTFTAAEIPDTVEVGVIADEYEPARFPHGKIVRTLMAYIDTSRIATHFHGHEDVVCQGCHHHSPVGETPPLCENCHGEPFDPTALHRPGLYGAYHRQCIGCHQRMNILDARDCTSCHKAKEQTVAGSNG